MSVRGLPVEQQERYLTRREIAELMNLSTKTIDGMIKAGAPHERWGLRAVRVLPSRFLQWAREQDMIDAQSKATPRRQNARGHGKQEG